MARAHLVLLLLALCVLHVALAQPLPWPVAYHDYQRSSSSPFVGPKGKWHDHDSLWRNDLGGTSYLLYAGMNGTAVVGISLDGNKESASSSYSSSSTAGFIALSSGSSFISIGSSGFSSGGISSSSLSSSDSSSSGDSSSDGSSSSARRRRQSPNYGEEIAFFSAGGGLTYTQPSVAPLNFVFTIDSTAAKAYQVLYNAFNGSITPVASGLFIGGTSFWLTSLPDLFAALAVPISVHVDFFPVSQVVLITGYSNTGEQVFAAIDAANGNILWQKDEFFFEATSATALNFAVNVNETKAYTAQFISSGFQICAWDISFRGGVYSQKWCHNDSVSETGPIGPVILSTYDGMIIAQYSGSLNSSYLWAVYEDDGHTYYKLSFTSAIVGLSVAPNSFLWIAFANGTVMHATRSPQFLYDWSVNVCPPNAPMQTPISDAEGTVYVVCGHHVTGLHANKTIRFLAGVPGGYWEQSLTPVLGGDDLLYAATEAHLYAWSHAPKHHKSSSTPPWWIFAAIAGGIVVVSLVTYGLIVFCRRSRYSYYDSIN